MARAAYQILKDTNALPSPSGVAMEILRLVGDEKVTLDAVGRVVESDPALAGRMLKLVNSPLFGITRKIASATHAVKLLGLRTVKTLALGLSLVANNRRGSCKGFDYEAFWSKSLARAVAARQLAQRFKSFPPDEAFTIGLLAKIGCLALATVKPEEYARVRSERTVDDDIELSRMEQKAFGLDHNELSSEMMADWHLHELFCEAVRLQDAPDQPGVETASRAGQLARLLHLAGAVASLLVDVEADAECLSRLARRAHAYGVSGEDLNPLMEVIASQWQEAGTIFSVSTTDRCSLQELRERVRSTHSPAADGAGSSPADEAVAKDPPHVLRILVVDDDAATARLLERHLSGAGHRVWVAANGLEALDIDRREAPQMIITDWMMPEIDGLELCRRLRGNEERGFVYIMVLTAQAEKARVVEALEAGADDFVTKPFSREELLAHVHAGTRIVRLEAKLADRSREITYMNCRLAAANDSLRIAATTDALTGLVNRREGMARLAEHWSLSDRYGEPLSCIIADIDHFKRVNDTYGHEAGDAVLKATAAALRRSARVGEQVCRMGGEEFLIVCPKSPVGAAASGAERLRRAVESNTIRSDSHEWSVTVSMGVAERTASMAHPDDVLRAADEMLYAAKAAGRNCVEVADARAARPRLPGAVPGTR